MSTLHTPLVIGPLHLSHRVVLAPLTRMRAEAGATRAADGRILCPTRLRGRLPDRRSHHRRRQRQRLPGRARPVRRQPDRRLEAGHRRRPRQGRQRSSCSSTTPAASRTSSVQPAGSIPVAPSEVARRRRLHRRRLGAEHAQPRPDASRKSKAWSKLPPRRHTRREAGFDGVNSMPPTATCSTSSCRTAATSAPTSMAARSKTARASCSTPSAP
jgi:hypothetical protein